MFLSATPPFPLQFIHPFSFCFVWALGSSQVLELQACTTTLGLWHASVEPKALYMLEKALNQQSCLPRPLYPHCQSLTYLSFYTHAQVFLFLLALLSTSKLIWFSGLSLLFPSVSLSHVVSGSQICCIPSSNVTTLSPVGKKTPLEAVFYSLGLKHRPGDHTVEDRPSMVQSRSSRKVRSQEGTGGSRLPLSAVCSPRGVLLVTGPRQQGQPITF